MKLVNITDLKSVGHYDLAGSSPAPRIYTKSRSDPMKYKLEDRYVWFEEGTQIVKMYFINGIPFTFDELPDGALYDKELVEIANKEDAWDMDELYAAYQYLMEEECHPMMFELELENPEILPVD